MKNASLIVALGLSLTALPAGCDATRLPCCLAEGGGPEEGRAEQRLEDRREPSASGDGEIDAPREKIPRVHAGPGVIGEGIMVIL